MLKDAVQGRSSTVRFESSLHRVTLLGIACIFLPVSEISYVCKIIKLNTKKIVMTIQCFDFLFLHAD